MKDKLDDLNIVVLEGDIDSDIKKGTMGTGTDYAIFTLKNTRYIGFKKPSDLYISVFAYNFMAKVATRYSKGDSVRVVGNLNMKPTESETGKKVFEVCVRASDIVGNRKEPVKKPIEEKNDAARAVNETLDSVDIVDDDLPF